MGTDRVGQSNYLLTWRLSHGWRQREAAQALGVGERHYRRLERGQKRLTRQVQKTIELVGWGDQESQRHKGQANA